MYAFDLCWYVNQSVWGEIMSLIHVWKSDNETDLDRIINSHSESELTGCFSNRDISV